MTTTFLLVRHATHALLDGTLVGRMPDVHISPEGQVQARRVAARLAALEVQHLQTSPQLRALETAAEIGRACRLQPEVTPAVNEIDVGSWQGRSFTALRDDPDWRHWNERRSEARAPGGESMREVQDRIVSHVVGTARRHPEQTAAIVSHSDVIKSAVLHYVGAPLDSYDRLEIAPASITTLVVGDWGGKIVRLNEEAAA